jgi:hypothetical protein
LLADRFDAVAEQIAAHTDAAATVLLHKWSFSERGPEHGYGGPGSIVKPNPATNWTTENRDQALGCERTAGRVDASPGGWPPVAVLPRIPAAADVAIWLGTPGDLSGCVVYMDPPYSDLPAIVAPAFVALDVVPHPDDGAEWGGTLHANGLDALRPAFDDMRMMLPKVLGPIFAQFEILNAVVQLILIAVVDDLVWSQWASKMPLHDEAVFQDVAACVAHHAVSALVPPVTLAGAADGGFFLSLCGRLRGPLSGFYESATRSAPQLRKALAGTDEAIMAGLRTVATDVRTAADLAKDIERHVTTLRKVRLDSSTKYARPLQKVTGYQHVLSRAEVVSIAIEYASMGAHVAISEAVPIPELVALGWHVADITGGRKGQARTFSKQKSEYLTMNQPAAYTISTQLGMFG